MRRRLELLWDLVLLVHRQVIPNIDGGAIDGAVIGAQSAAAGTFTTINASRTITGNLTGAVTGNSTATVLANARTITIDGDVDATATAFDGSTNITLTTTLDNTGVTAASIW